jgi:cytochrome b
MVKVWDPLIRGFHWSLALCFVIAYISEDEILFLHVWAGYTLLGLLAFRLLWGFFGPRHARFTNFIYRPATVLGYLKDIATSRAKRYLGHNPAGGAMVVALLLSLLATALSGLAVYGAQEFAGPLAAWLGGVEYADSLEDLHEFLANLTLLLIVLHVLGVIAASWQHKENLLAAMFTGNKRADNSSTHQAG